ncbi:hypothetical protein F2Q68_00000015 [Brassica cretica]|uniref:Uncharacterized protein n=1 Tax=Brassica cretica TaxID=69181 RepID=A0A8S9JIV4_BRACR|nr:hypothetical protein F2Q68_00000015 [Brassica cretica]
MGSTERLRRRGEHRRDSSRRLASRRGRIESESIVEESGDFVDSSSPKIRTPIPFLHVKQESIL